VVAIGSGGPYAHAAAAALLQNTDLGAEEIARRALHIAARLCIYTNENITVETLDLAAPAEPAPG
jgi:ATP-dependent HslUV protease, peptidase subunit HslV